MAGLPSLAARLVLLTRVDAHEGPVYVAGEDALYVTTARAPAGTSILRIQLEGLAKVDASAVSVLRAGTANANGMALAGDGRLVVCEQGTLSEPARICLVNRASGAARTLVDAVDGKPLNSPNDVVVARDGSVWFTDPGYGALQGFRPPPEGPDAVYRHDPATGVTAAVASGFDKPNGLTFSPAEDVLYVADSGADRGDGTFEPERPHEVVRFAVTAGRLTDRERFAVVGPGAPDGIVTDSGGRVHVTTGAGIAVYEPDGTPVGHIDLPGAVNMTFTPAGALLVTADTAVWAVIW